jgi:hypothetical protein
MEGWSMTTEDWGFIKDLLDVLVLRLNEQDKKIELLEKQISELRKSFV